MGALISEDADLGLDGVWEGFQEVGRITLDSTGILTTSQNPSIPNAQEPR